MVGRGKKKGKESGEAQGTSRCSGREREAMRVGSAKGTFRASEGKRQKRKENNAADQKIDKKGLQTIKGRDAYQS